MCTPCATEQFQQLAAWLAISENISRTAHKPRIDCMYIALAVIENIALSAGEMDTDERKCLNGYLRGMRDIKIAKRKVHN